MKGAAAQEELGVLLRHRVRGEGQGEVGEASHPEGQRAAPRCAAAVGLPPRGSRGTTGTWAPAVRVRDGKPLVGRVSSCAVTRLTRTVRPARVPALAVLLALLPGAGPAPGPELDLAAGLRQLYAGSVRPSGAMEAPLRGTPARWSRGSARGSLPGRSRASSPPPSCCCRAAPETTRRSGPGCSARCRRPGGPRPSRRSARRSPTWTRARRSRRPRHWPRSAAPESLDALQRAAAGAPRRRCGRRRASPRPRSAGGAGPPGPRGRPRPSPPPPVRPSRPGSGAECPGG